MATIEEEIECVEVIHRKGDDFFRVFELMTEEGDDFDPSDIDFIWTISDKDGILITISGADMTVVDNQVEIRKAYSFFDALIFMGSYTHRLYDDNSNTTLFDGKFLLK